MGRGEGSSRDVVRERSFCRSFSQCGCRGDYGGGFLSLVVMSGVVVVMVMSDEVCVVVVVVVAVVVRCV